MTSHQTKYLIAAAALSIATLLPAGTTAAAVSQETCAGHWALTPSSPPPGVLGQSVESAAASLRADGYDCKVVNDKPTTVDEGVVVVAAQNTRTENDPDGSISLVHLSLGVVMPDLAGKTLRVARETVTQLGLAVRTSPSDGTAGWTVRLQRPGAGDYVAFGRAVTLILEKSAQPALVPVPDLIDRTEDEAAALVKDAGFNYKPRILKDGKRPGRVVSQQPQPGDLVEPTATVTADIRRVPTPPPTPPPTTVVPTTPPAVVRTVVPEFAADESGWPSWLVPLLLVTAVVAAGTVSRIRHRPRTHPKPVPQIRVTARLGQGRLYLQEKIDEHQ
ncbi:PASTA domain-containing protein [Kribbella sp. NPDC055110]